MNQFFHYSVLKVLISSTNPFEAEASKVVSLRSVVEDIYLHRIEDIQLVFGSRIWHIGGHLLQSFLYEMTKGDSPG